MQTCNTTPCFYMGSWNMNSGPHGKFVSWALSLTCICRVESLSLTARGASSAVESVCPFLDLVSVSMLSQLLDAHVLTLATMLWSQYSIRFLFLYLEMCVFLLFVNFPDLFCYWCLTLFYCGKRTCVTLLLYWIDGFCFVALHMVLEDVHHMLEKSLCLVISGSVVSR